MATVTNDGAPVHICERANLYVVSQLGSRVYMGHGMDFVHNSFILARPGGLLLLWC